MAHKLYKKGKVHPSPPQPSAVYDHLSLFLPAAILTLAAALSPQDKQVLAYLLSCSSNSAETLSRTIAVNRKNDHPPMFECSCFRCYMSFWSRWNTSPNREVIHEIIEAYEDYQDGLSKKRGGKQRRRKGRGFEEGLRKDDDRKTAAALCGGGVGGDDGEVGDGNVEEVGVEQGLVCRIGTFLGDKIWGMWNTI